MRSRDLRKLIGTDTLVDARITTGWWPAPGKVTRWSDDDGHFSVCGRDFVIQAIPRDIRLHVPAKKAASDHAADAVKYSTAPAKKSPEVGSAEWAEEMGRQGKRVRGDEFCNSLKYIELKEGNWVWNDGKPSGSPTKPMGRWNSKKWSLYEEPAAEQPKPAPTFKVGDVVDATWEDWKISGGEIIESAREEGWYTVGGKWTDGHGCSCWNMAARVEKIRHHVAKEEAKSAPHVVPIAANIRDAIEAMKRVSTMAEIEIGRLEALIK